MSKTCARVISLAAAALFAVSCQSDQQEAQKFERADSETFQRDMSEMTSFTLANGVAVYIQEERTDDQVAIEVLYRAGFVLEPKGQPQISHLTEHMAIYCAMGDYAADASLAKIKEQDGMLNAEAVADFVHIDYIVKGTRIEEAFQIEADRLRAIRCDNATLEREREKVTKEIETVVANPKGVLTKFGLSALHQVYRFGVKDVPLRGKVSELGIEDVHRFHNDNYRPNDMIIVVIGNIKTAEVEALARKYIEPVAQRPTRALPDPALTRSTSATWDVGAEAIYLVAPGPYANERERLILTMFGAYLLQSMSTTQEVYSACKTVYCTNQVYRVSSLPFFVFAEPAAGRTTADVAKLLRDHIEGAVANLKDSSLLTNIRGSVVGFVTTSMLKPDVPDYPLAHHQVIGQEALNVGMKHLLREGSSVDDFSTLIASITDDEMRTTVHKYLAPDRIIQITFGPRT